MVAYPPHGVGGIAARKKRVVLGVEQEIVVIELADGLSVTLPLDRARDDALGEEVWGSIRLKQQQLLKAE